MFDTLETPDMDLQPFRPVYIQLETVNQRSNMASNELRLQMSVNNQNALKLPIKKTEMFQYLSDANKQTGLSKIFSAFTGYQTIARTSTNLFKT
jgi:hypothetical protein